jgi:nicotinamidase-related amidase
MKTVLLLIDIQNDYFPGGRMELERCNEAAIQAEKLLNEFRKNKMPVIHIQHISVRKGATFFLPGTDGINFYTSVKPGENETVIQKYYPNSFRGTNLLECLKTLEAENLIICGMMTHMCIDATTRAAFDNGFQCIVAEDACATKSLIYKGNTIPASHVHQSFLAALSSVYAKVLTADEIIQLIFTTKVDYY